jgi:hypothetical protein
VKIRLRAKPAAGVDRPSARRHALKALVGAAGLAALAGTERARPAGAYGIGEDLTVSGHITSATAIPYARLTLRTAGGATEWFLQADDGVGGPGQRVVCDRIRARAAPR